MRKTIWYFKVTGFPAVRFESYFLNLPIAAFQFKVAYFARGIAKHAAQYK